MRSWFHPAGLPSPPQLGLLLFARGSPTRGAVERSETERLYRRILCPGSGCSRFRDPEALPRSKQLRCPTSPSSLRDATSPSRGGKGFSATFLALPLGELAAKQTERLYGRILCPGSGCFRFRDPEVLPQTKQLLCPTSPSTPLALPPPLVGEARAPPPRSWLSLWESCRAERD